MSVENIWCAGDSVGEVLDLEAWAKAVRAINCKYCDSGKFPVMELGSVCTVIYEAVWYGDRVE